jgi:hypothetical protein
VRFLPELYELTERLRVPANLTPVYDFSGTQGFAPETIQSIKYYARRPRVFVNLAALEFVKSGGNNLLWPRCRAKETTITLLPDGQFVSPCFFNPGGEQGRGAICSSCMRWPYMLPSFRVGWDKYYWWNWFSETRKNSKHKT